MSNDRMIITIRAMLEEYNLPWKYRQVLAWCIAKLIKEQNRGEEG